MAEQQAQAAAAAEHAQRAAYQQAAAVAAFAQAQATVQVLARSRARPLISTYISMVLSVRLMSIHQKCSWSLGHCDHCDGSL
jgi:hypothetical protein